MLRGLGVSLALPLLESMVPAMTALAQTAARPVRRLGVVYVPNGMAMEYWTPASQGATFELTPILRPLEPFRDQMLVLSGLHGYWDATHAGGSTSFLDGSGGTDGGGRHPDRRRHVRWIRLSRRKPAGTRSSRRSKWPWTVEAIRGSAAAATAASTRTPSPGPVPPTPLPGESSPRAVFERLFGDTASTDARERSAAVRKGRSILDSVVDKVAGLQQRVGPGDRSKIDEYLDLDSRRRAAIPEGGGAERARSCPSSISPPEHRRRWATMRG